MTTRTEAVHELPLCSGVLTTWRKDEVLEAYGDVPETEGELWAVFQRNGAETEIHSAEDLYRVLVQCGQGFDLSSEISPFTAELAELTGFLLDVRALTGQFWCFLEDYHPISLRDHLPRVEGHDFKFLLADFSEGSSKPTMPGRISPINFSKTRFIEVSIDLRTGTITRAPLYRTAKTESFLTLPICGGVLTGWRQVDAVDAGDDPLPRSKLWAVFRRDSTEAVIHSVDELYRVLCAQDCDLSAEVAPVTVGLAQLTAALLGRFRAVTDLEWDSDLKRHLDLSFSIRDELPRVDGSLFRFLVVDLSTSYRKGCLHGVEIDLRTGVITRQPRS
jgi:hypothetical protein